MFIILCLEHQEQRVLPMLSHITETRVMAVVIVRQKGPPSNRGRTAMLAKFFDGFWGWADYEPKDWSNASYKRGYTSESGHGFAKFFDGLWGWADYGSKDWSNASYKRGYAS
jgi:hypothetical protein